MTKPADPAAYAVELIEKALPGFETRIDAMRDRIQCRAPIHFGGTINSEALYHGAIYPIPSAPTFVGFDDPTKLAYDPRNVEAVVAHLVEMTRRAAIEKLGLEELIVERVELARAQGRRDGFADGKRQGYAEGRADQLQEILDALRDDAAGKREASRE